MADSKYLRPISAASLRNEVDFGVIRASSGHAPAEHGYITVQLQETHRVNFSCHAENGELVIDECEGITPEAGLSLFDGWMIEAMLEKSK